MSLESGEDKMKKAFKNAMSENPVIAAVKSYEKIDEAVNSDCRVIFILCGDIFNLKEMVDKAKAKGKLVFIHTDLIEGFSRDATALKYIAERICPDGIISTKNSQLKTAKQMGLLTVHRLFIIDSLSIETTVRASALIEPDAVEIMPGIMPRITKRLASELSVPVIVGGLISEKDDIKNAIENGAEGVSTSDNKLW